MDYFNGEWRRVAVPLNADISALGLTHSNGATVVELDDFGVPISISPTALAVIDRVEQHWPVIDSALADQFDVLADEPLPLRYWLLTRLDAEGNPPDSTFAILPWDQLDRAVDAVAAGLEPDGEIGELVELRHWLTPAVHGLTGPLEQLDHGLRTGDDRIARIGATELLTKLRNVPVSRIPARSKARLAHLVARLDSLYPQHGQISRIVAARLTGQLNSARPATPEPEVIDPAALHEVRIISIYATGWSSAWRQDDRLTPRTHLKLGALEEFYSRYQEQFPRMLLPPQTHRPDAVTFARSGQDGHPPIDNFTATRAESWLFALPSDQVVAAIAIDFRSPPLNTNAALAIAALGRGAYAQFKINGKDVAAHIAELALRAGAKEFEENTPLPLERHQIVLSSRIADSAVPTDETIALLLHRSDPPYRPEFMKVRRPDGLNSGSTVCAVTPYVSLLYGHPEYIENSVFLTAVQAVGTSAQLRQIWHRTHGRIRDLRHLGQAESVGERPKSAVEFLSDELGNLELELSFSVEASADFGLFISSLGIESFHRELYEAMELRERAETVSRMFSRLDASLRSEIAAIDIREQEDVEGKRVRRSTAISVLSLVSVPLAFFVAYFGINTQVADTNFSLWDWDRYFYVYLTGGILALAPLITLLILNGRAWLKIRLEQRIRKYQMEIERTETAQRTPQLPRTGRVIP
jgi:hypothetical protein